MSKWRHYKWNNQQVGTITDPTWIFVWGGPPATIVIDITSGNSTCADAIAYYDNLPAASPLVKSPVDSAFANLCASQLLVWVTSPQGVSSTQTIANFSYGVDPAIYTPIRELNYEVLNDGTLSVSTDVPNGQVKLNKELTVFEKSYFDNIIDVNIHELLPEMPERWPKEPPVLRQIWPHKAGPGGWPSGPEQVSKGKKDKVNVWDRTDYFNIGLGFQWTTSNPPDPLWQDWGPITSNRYYPMPPGILCYNVVDYVTDGAGYELAGQQLGSAGLGKYIVLNDDRPLFIADAYNFKTDDSEEMKQEWLQYGNNVEVEDNLEYEWIVDGKTVSTNKWYQVWGQGRNHPNVAATDDTQVSSTKNNSFDTSIINVTLIVKNNIGSVSTNISYMVWGGTDNTGAKPLDYGRDGDTTPQGESPNNYYWGTPFWKDETSWGFPGLVEPWGSYYTWDSTKNEEVVIETGTTITTTTDPEVQPWSIWMGGNGDWGSLLVATTALITEPGLNVGPNSLGGATNWQDFVDYNSVDGLIPQINTGLDLIDRCIYMSPTNRGIYGNDLTGFLNFWRSKVWSQKGFSDGTRIGPNERGSSPPGGVIGFGSKSVWLRAPSSDEEAALGAPQKLMLRIKMKKVLLGGGLGGPNSIRRELTLVVPSGLPTSTSNNNRGDWIKTIDVPGPNWASGQTYEATYLNSNGYVLFHFDDFDYVLTDTQSGTVQTDWGDNWMKLAFWNRLQPL